MSNNRINFFYKKINKCVELIFLQKNNKCIELKTLIKFLILKLCYNGRTDN